MTIHHTTEPAHAAGSILIGSRHTPLTTEPWLFKKQLAVHLGFSTRWVELRLREGMPSRMIGGCRRFRLSEVESWVDGRQPADRSR